MKQHMLTLGLKVCIWGTLCAIFCAWLLKVESIFGGGFWKTVLTLLGNTGNTGNTTLIVYEVFLPV